MKFKQYVHQFSIQRKKQFSMKRDTITSIAVQVMQLPSRTTNGNNYSSVVVTFFLPILLAQITIHAYSIFGFSP